MSEGIEDDSIESITPDVLAVLAKAGYFAKLDDLLCPTQETIVPAICTGGYKFSEPILVDCGFDAQERGEILGVLHSAGGCCDCEVLYNVTESSRFKAKHWKARSEKIASGRPRHSS